MFRRLTVAAVAAAACVGAQPAFVKLPAPNAMPVPTPQQLKYQGGISALIHFNMATVCLRFDRTVTEPVASGAHHSP